MAATRDIATFETDSIRFAYPTNWQAESEANADGVTVTLQSQGISFAIVGVYANEYEPDDLMEQAVESLRNEHPTLEAEEDFDEEDASGEDDTDAVAIEAVFYSLDMLTYCWLRSWRLEGNSVLVMMQCIEPESKIGRAVFQAICRSLTSIG